MFIGGDVLVGGLFEINVSDVTMECLISSGINHEAGTGEFIGFRLDDNFEIADNIGAKLKLFTNKFNFGVTDIIVDSPHPIVKNTVMPSGSDIHSWGIFGGWPATPSDFYNAARTSV
jgi:hypothetical protein